MNVNGKQFNYKINNQYIPYIQSNEIFKYLGVIRTHNNNTNYKYQIIKKDFLEIIDKYKTGVCLVNYCIKHTNKDKEVIEKAYSLYKSSNILSYFQLFYKKYYIQFPMITNLILDASKMFDFKTDDIKNKIITWTENEQLNYIIYSNNDFVLNNNNQQLDTYKKYYSNQQIEKAIENKNKNKQPQYMSV